MFSSLSFISCSQGLPVRYCNNVAFKRKRKTAILTDTPVKRALEAQKPKKLQPKLQPRLLLPRKVEEKIGVLHLSQKRRDTSALCAWSHSPTVGRGKSGSSALNARSGHMSYVHKWTVDPTYAKTVIQMTLIRPTVNNNKLFESNVPAIWKLLIKKSFLTFYTAEA